MSAVGRELTVFERVGTTEQTCNLGHNHKQVAVLRRYVLAVVEERTVPQKWAIANGAPADSTATGLRAVDQFGDEWTRDWHGTNGDGPGYWRASDGRTAERGRGYPDYDQPPAHDGYLIENQEGQA